MRGLLVVVLVFLSCVLLIAAVVGIWSRRNFLDNERFVSRVAPLADDPAVQQAVAGRITEDLMTIIDPRTFFVEALPERVDCWRCPWPTWWRDSWVSGSSSSWHPTGSSASSLARSSAPHRQAVRILRDESDLIETADGTTTLNLVAAANAVLARITSGTPEILGREVNLPDVSVEDLPDAAVKRLEAALDVDLEDGFGQITVYSQGRLEAAQDGIRLFDRGVVAVAIATLVLAALAIWLSRRRRRTIVQLAFGGVVAMVLLRRVIFRVQDDVAEIPDAETGRQAVTAVLDQFLDPLLLGTAILVVGFILVAVFAADYPWVVSLRRRARVLGAGVIGAVGGRAQDESTIAWVARSPRGAAGGRRGRRHPAAVGARPLVARDGDRVGAGRCLRARRAADRLLGCDCSRNRRPSRRVTHGSQDNRSPGWQRSTSHNASSVENRTARALPVLRIDRFASVMPTFSESSVSVMLRAASRSSRCTRTGTSDGALFEVAQRGAFVEDLGEGQQSECDEQEHPPVRRRDRDVIRASASTVDVEQTTRDLRPDRHGDEQRSEHSKAEHVANVERSALASRSDDAPGHHQPDPEGGDEQSSRCGHHHPRVPVVLAEPDLGANVGALDPEHPVLHLAIATHHERRPLLHGDLEGWLEGCVDGHATPAADERTERNDEGDRPDGEDDGDQPQEAVEPEEAPAPAQGIGRGRHIDKR